MTAIPTTQSKWRSAGKFALAAILTLVLNIALIYASFMAPVISGNSVSGLGAGLIMLLIANMGAVAVSALQRQYSIAAGLTFGLVCTVAGPIAIFIVALSAFRMG